MFINRNIKRIILAICLIILIFLPKFIAGYGIRILTAIFMYAIIAQGINLMSGYMGYLPFGNAMFFGVGAYITAIMMAKGLTFLLAMILGGIASILVSTLFGLPVLRLRGHYFAIATIGVSGALLSIVQNATEITGGAMGTTLPVIEGSPQVTYSYFYWGMLTLMIVVTLIISYVMKTKFGYGIRSIKANEEAADAMGINTTQHKVITWAISAFFTSLAGSIYAYWMSFIAPDEVFNIMIIVHAIVILLIGGMGTVLGPIIGAFIIELLSEVAWSNFLEYHLAVMGIVTLIIIFFIPKGVVGTFSEIRKKRKIRQGEKEAV